MTKKIRSDGFSAVAFIVAVFVIVAFGIAGWRILQNKDTAIVKSSSSSTTTKKTTEAKPVDTYVGWQTYCDSYNYCFKYPKDWVQMVSTTAVQPCDAGGLSLRSPDGLVDMSYLNANNKDGDGLVGSYTITSSDAISLKNQSLTIIGGYASSEGSRYPSYNLIDTPTSTAHLDVGQVIDLPTKITDQGTGEYQCSASFDVAPSQPLSASDAQAWFTTKDAELSLKILQSFYYQ